MDESWRSNYMKMQSTLKNTTGSAILSQLNEESVIKQVRRFFADVRFERKHPFLTEWKDWKEVVIKYHSTEVAKMCTLINRGYATCESEGFPEDMEEYALEVRRLVEINITNVCDPVTYKCKYKNLELTAMSGHNERCSCYRLEDEKDCIYKHFHHLENLIVLLWTRFVTKGHPRRDRKYFDRLQRIMLSLPWDKLKDFDIDLINNPPKYKGRGRNLLRELYARAYFDKFDIGKMPFIFEELKHLRIATQQCQSGNVYDKMLKATQQGLTHNVELPDHTVEKIQKLLKESQENFMSNLSSTLVLTTKQILILFLIATTVGLLTRILVGFSLAIIIKLLNLIYRFLVPYEAPKYVVKQQGADLSIPLLPALVAKYVIGAPAKVMNKLWKNPNFDLVMRRIGYLGDPKMATGIDKITEWGKQIVLKVVNWYRENMLGLGPLEDLQSETCQLDVWNAECDDLVKSYYSGEMVWTDSTWSVLMNLYSRGLGFTRNHAYTKYKNDIWKVITKLGNLLEKFSQRMRSNTSVRNPPVTIYFTGESGVGKSSITYPFAVEVLKGIFEKEKSPIDLQKCWKNLIYMRAAEQEFWDGYENQLVTVFDDFNQQVDTDGNPSMELFEVIRASNCFPYPLHMAALDQKSNTTFNSKIILASSNNPQPISKSLNYPTALYRRFDICVRVARKNMTLNTGTFDPSLFEFQLYDMKNMQPLEFITYKELVYMAVTSYFQRKGFVDSVDKYITESLKDYKKAEQQGVSDWIIAARKKAFSICPTIQEGMKSVRDFFNPKSLINIFYDIRESVEHIKQQADERKSWWKQFRHDHAYFISAMSFVGLLGICFAVVQTVISFSKDAEKSANKVLTFKQFERILGTSESTKDFKPGKVSKVESTHDKVPVKTSKVESTHVSQPAKVVKVEAVKVPREASEQGVLDVNASEIMMKAVRNNMYKMKDVTTGVYIGHCLFIKGKICLMPFHYMSTFDHMLDMDENCEIEFDGIILSRSFRMYVKDLVDACVSYESPPEGEEVVISRDLMSAFVPSAIYHSDMTAHFVQKESVQYVKNVKAYLPVLVSNDLKKSDRPVLLVRFVEGKSQITVTQELAVTADTDDVVRCVRNAWTYNMDTRPTECGAPLVVRNPMITPGKICGIHIAGIENAGEGFSTPVYKEDIVQIIKQHPDQPSMKYRVELQPVKEQSCLKDDLQFVRLGTLEKGIPQPTKSKIKPSLVHGKIQEPKTRTCLLYKTKIDGVDFDPRAYRIEKLGKPTIAISQKMIDIVGEALEDRMMEALQQGIGDPTIKSVYTYAEAVQGIAGSQYINSLKRTSSPGFPFVQMNEYKTKIQIYGNKDVFDIQNERSRFVEERVNDIIDHARENVCLDHYFCDTLKDERKPIHKSHKTRLFSAGALDYLLACKMYFNGIVALIEKNKNNCGISVGTNVYSDEWKQIANILLTKSDRMIAGDFEGFDASQHMCLLEKCGEILINLSKRLLGSTDEDARIMKVLLVSLFNSNHIIGDEVYQWTHSLPSGHYLTAIINSLFVNLVFGCVWCISFNNFDYMFARKFWMECGIVAYGDDHIVSIPNWRIGVLNQFTLPDIFREIGLSYTMEDKDAVVKSFSRPLHEIAYLKRGFRTIPRANKVVAPLSLDTILETPMWMHQVPDARAQTIENLEWAIKELSLHSIETWKKYFPLLNALLLSLDHLTVFKNYREVQNLVLEQ
ncbi:putative RNA-dependent RNA polymerase [Linepithema humile picorna-like virus 1]|nr:putative RNA-dependent RNA polymerase [Linepithema humile picorna-like virus 1]